jgi:hypothetical protein
MGVEEKEFFQEGTEQIGIGREPAGQRRGQGYAEKLDPAAGEKPVYFTFFHAPHIFVPGIVAEIVIPQDMAPGLQDPEHLTGYRLFHGPVQYGSEEHGLQHQVEGAGRKRQIGCVGLRQANLHGQDRPGRSQFLKDQVDAREVFRPGPPLDKFPQPIAGAAADLENFLLCQAAQPLAFEQVQDPSFPFLDIEQVPRVKPGI